MDATGLDATNLARKAGLVPSTLNRFMNKPVTHLLSGRTLAAISKASGVSVPLDIGSYVAPISVDIRAQEVGEAKENFTDHPNAAAAASARAHKADIVRAITAEPELFAWLMAAYRQLHQEEGVAITDDQLAALVLDDYAELVTECATPEERRILANGFVVKQRGWLRRNKDRIGA